MFVGNVKNIQGVDVNAAGAVNAVKKNLIGPGEGWEGWVMRVFTLGENGQTPRHSHPWPHINYITGGKGILYMDGKEYEVEEGSTAYIPGDIEHQFKNGGQGEFSFICIVPEEGDK